MQTDPNPDLSLAFNFVQYTNRNIFLTGKAGTGKTTFLHTIKQKSPKRMVVVAPTGVAAINAGGVTIHSFFQLPFHPHIPVQYFPEQDTSSASGSFKLSRDKIRIIKSMDLLVIDEISMVRADLLDAVDHTLRRFRNRAAPFGGVQLLMIGDIQQLAPVAKHEEWEILEKYYHTPFFFGSLALRNTDYVTVELKHIYRQQDQEFIALLNKVRDNQLDSGSMNLLNTRYDPQFKPADDSGYITLTTHNAQAQSINDSRLEQLPSRAKVFKAIVKDDFPEYAYPTSQELILKKGAQVMFVKNDISRDKLYFNGKIGRVEGFEDELILVQCPGDDRPIAVSMAEWQNMKYSVNDDTREIDETVIGTFTQYPLKLAWAITIHKSQGLTFDKAIIDARAAFAHGQVYVALSRCRTLGGLVLSTPVSKQGIISDAAVKGFVHECEQNRPDEATFEDSRRTYEKMLIYELFDFSPLIRSLHYFIKMLKENAAGIVNSPLAVSENMVNFIHVELMTISEKFKSELNRLMGMLDNAELNEPLQERIKKACVYFNGKMADVLALLAVINIETDNKAVRKSVTEPLNRLRLEANIKTACLEKMKSGFSISDYLDTKAKASLEEIPAKSPAPKHIEDASGIDKHPVLYNRIRKWRDMKARQEDLPHYMVLPLNTIATLASVHPTSYEMLQRVKGMGKKKSEKYGDEIISIITEYCSEKNIESETVPEIKNPKKAKSSVNTRQMTFNLYKEGNNIAQIAHLRALTVNTVENHLAFYIGTGELPVTDLISVDLLNLIASQFEESGSLQLAPVKLALGDRVNWSDIRFVAKHLEYVKRNS